MTDNSNPTDTQTSTETVSDSLCSITLDWLPEEVTAYAFDQFTDRAMEALATEQYHRPLLYPDELATLNYETRTVHVDTTATTELLRDAVLEKLNDIEYEIEHGERTDYTVHEIKQYRTRATNEL